MIDAPDRSWRYIGLPRTGSTLLHRVLKEHYDGVEIGGQHSAEILYGAKIIVSCRNPYTRLVSLWKHKLYQMGLILNKRQGPDGRIIPVKDRDYPFQSFIGSLGCKRKDRDAFYYWTQSEWLRHVVRVDQVIRLEHLLEDFRRVPEWADPWFPLERENTSDAAKINYPIFRDPAVLGAVKQWAYQDCLHFGYDTELPEELKPLL